LALPLPKSGGPVALAQGLAPLKREEIGVNPSGKTFTRRQFLLRNSTRAREGKSTYVKIMAGCASLDGLPEPFKE